MGPNARLDDSGGISRECLLEVRALIEKALELLDESGASAEIAARLQEVIDALDRILEGPDY